MVPTVAAVLAFAALDLGPRAGGERAPEVAIVVFRYHPLVSISKERKADLDRDVKAILGAADGFHARVSGGLGRGYELSLHAGDLGMWRERIDKLLKDGELRYYDGWGLNADGYGLVPVRSVAHRPAGKDR